MSPFPPVSVPYNSKMPHNKPKSCFVQRVNSRKGCWYHSQQDHNPSLMLSNQIKWQETAAKDVGTTVDTTTFTVLMLRNQIEWQDVTLPPCFCSPQHEDAPR
jgi:hypothetical protein